MERFFSRRDLLRGIGASWATLAAWVVGSRALVVAAEGAEGRAATPVSSAGKNLEGGLGAAKAQPTYTFDKSGRITSVKYPPVVRYTFVYDADGTLLRRLDGPRP